MQSALQEHFEKIPYFWCISMIFWTSYRFHLKTVDKNIVTTRSIPTNLVNLYWSVYRDCNAQSSITKGSELWSGSTQMVPHRWFRTDSSAQMVPHRWFRIHDFGIDSSPTLWNDFMRCSAGIFEAGWNALMLLVYRVGYLFIVLFFVWFCNL